MTTFLIGQYGSGNLGDEAILKGMRAIPKFKSAIVIDEYKRIPMGIEIKDISRLVTPKDHLVIGGGGLFCGREELLHYVNMARFFKNYSIQGVGVDRVFSEEDLYVLALLFQQAEKVSVRNLESQESLKSIGISGVEVIQDFSSLMPACSKEKALEILKENNSSEGSIGINLHQPIKTDSLKEKFVVDIKKFASLIEDIIAKTQNNVVFIPTSYNKDGVLDLDIADRIKKRMSRSANFKILKERQYSSEEIKGIVGQLSLMIGSRYHSCAFALQMKTPLVVLALQEKQFALAGEYEIPVFNYKDFQKDILLDMIACNK
jgi:polysaccharide pyruvyl transferase WcaK-like protein